MSGLARAAALALAAAGLGFGLTAFAGVPMATAQGYVPCEQWQAMHPGWPCIDTPQPPPGGPPAISTPPPLPTQTPGLPSQPGSGGGIGAGALTPPPIVPGRGTPIVPVPGVETRPAPSGRTQAPAQSPQQQTPGAIIRRDIIDPYLHEAQVWGACGVNADRNKQVRTFDRRTVQVDGKVLVEGQSVLYCGTGGYGYFHIKDRHQQDWANTDRSRNWRDNADRAIENTLKNPEVACYRLENNTYTFGSTLYEYDKLEGELTGKTMWSNVTIDANSGRIITAFPSSNKPRCK